MATINRTRLSKLIPSPVTISSGTKVKQPRLSGPGRPYYIAILQPNDIDFRKEFQAVCDTLSFRQGRALARALDISYGTIVNWKKHRAFPKSWGVAAQVIEWGKAGKPITTQTPVGQCDFLREAAALRRVGLLPPTQ